MKNLFKGVFIGGVLIVINFIILMGIGLIVGEYQKGIIEYSKEVAIVVVITILLFCLWIVCYIFYMDFQINKLLKKNETK